MNTILVTGGAGFIGSNFTHFVLSRTPHRVVVVDKLTYAGNLLNLEGLEGGDRMLFVRADIADRPAMERIFRDHRPHAVVNFAAETHVDRSIDDPAPVIQTNIIGVYTLLETARAWLRSTGAPPPGAFRFLQVSTDEVYGSLGPEGLFREDTAYAPNSPYAASKAAADHLVRAWGETFRLPVLITNCSNNYGPRQFPEKLIPLMILNALEGRDLPIYGDGGNIRDWLFVEDHCSGIWRVLEAGRPGTKYNIGGNTEMTNLQVVDTLCEILGRLAPSEDNPALRSRGLLRYHDLKKFVPDRPGHDRRYAIDATRARTELGWVPGHDFSRGLEKTVRWYLDHRDWCEKVQAGKYSRERLGLSQESRKEGA